MEIRKISESEIDNLVLRIIEAYVSSQIKTGVWEINTGVLLEIFPFLVEYFNGARLMGISNSFKSQNSFLREYINELGAEHKVIISLEHPYGHDVVVRVYGLADTLIYSFGYHKTALWLDGYEEEVYKSIEQLVEFARNATDKTIVDSYEKFKKTKIYELWIKSKQ